jgi:hypothetical protein
VWFGMESSWQKMRRPKRRKPPRKVRTKRASGWRFYPHESPKSLNY